MPADLALLEAIFAEAVTRSDAADRAAYVVEACQGDHDLQRQVVGLLASDQEAGGFLRLPADTEATSPFVPLSEKPGSKIDRFKLLEQIGEGGFGVVFMAEQEAPIRRLVALKIIKLGMDTRQVVARFEAERQALALMNHPHVARVIDGGTTETGRPYFVMELVKGAPITKYCDQHRLTIRNRLELFGQVCRAVQHAHQKGLIHRDLKPSNVLVSTVDDRPVAKVIDFGVAKAIGARLTDETLVTEYRQLVGTPAYMSPEQAVGGLDVDTRSDVYSLGVLLYELLSGVPPFDPHELCSKAFGEMQRIICETEPPVPSGRLSTLTDTLTVVAAQRALEPRKLTSTVRGELDWIVMRCLEKDRKRRYESAAALASDVDRYLQDEPVHACSPPLTYRIGKFVRRNKISLAMGGLVALALLSAAGGMGWVVRDRSVRQAALELGVLAALGEVEGWYRRENWTEAGAAVKQAERLLAAGEHSSALSARVHRWRTDLETVGRLDDIVLSNAGGSQWESSAALNASYEREFRSLGIDIDALTLAEAANRIRQRRIAGQLTQALDHWAQFRLNLSYDEKQRVWVKSMEWCRRPLAIARTADPDPYHRRVRHAVETWNLAELATLTKQPAARDLPVSLLRLAARELYYDQDPQYRDEARDLLKRAQAAHPDDFWINVTMATHIAATNHTGGDDPSSFPSLNEAIPYATAAAALRPQNAQVRVLLANLWVGTGHVEQGALKEAEEVCRDAIAKYPKRASAHGNLGDVLYLQGRFELAAESFQKAIALAPGAQQLFLKLAQAQQLQGKNEESRATLRKASKLSENDAPSLNQLAWILATAPDPQHREPAIAINVAQRAVDLAPEVGEFWNTLGVAHFREGSWQRSIEALQKSMELRDGGDPSDWLFLAMAHWQLNHVDEAGKWYDKAVDGMDDKAIQNGELMRFRNEATELLGR